MKDTVASNTIGQVRFQSDKRQLGGLLMLLGAAALVFPMANVSTLIGPDGTTASEGIALSSLIAGIFVISMGLISVPLGFAQAVMDISLPNVTFALIVWTQLAWMPFLTDLTMVGQMARSGDAFIPEAYDPTPLQVKFVGAMGMMGILGYGTGFLGSLAFIEFALLAYQTNRPSSRNGSYYRGRLTLYAFCNLLVGLSQLLLGSFILINFGLSLENGPIEVAMYMVHFPQISIAVGALQTLNAFYGLLRSVGFLTTTTQTSTRQKEEWLYPTMTLIQWVATVTLQIMVQVAYAPGGNAAAAAPSQTMLTLGLSTICVFLDYKGRTTPDDLKNSDYGLKDDDDDDDLDDDMHKGIQNHHADDHDDDDDEEMIRESAVSSSASALPSRPSRSAPLATDGDWSNREDNM